MVASLKLATVGTFLPRKSANVTRGPSAPARELARHCSSWILPQLWVNLKFKSFILMTLINFVLCLAYWYTKIIDFLISHRINNCFVIRLMSPEPNGQSVKNETTSNYVLMKYSCQTNESECIWASIPKNQFVDNMKNRKQVNDTTRKQSTKSRVQDIL